jgi:hypothetical protein
VKILCVVICCTDVVFSRYCSKKEGFSKKFARSGDDLEIEVK